MNAYEQIRAAITKAEAVIDGTRMMVLQGQEYDLGLLDFDGALKMLRAALDLPRRQCDVGTADEQDARFSRFCVEKRSGSCSGCPDAVGGFTVANGIRECALVWAQMPYTAEGEASDEV